MKVWVWSLALNKIKINPVQDKNIFSSNSVANPSKDLSQNKNDHLSQPFEQLLDELHGITRNLCGEVPFKGFEQWKGVHQRAHAPAPVT